MCNADSLSRLSKLHRQKLYYARASPTIVRTTMERLGMNAQFSSTKASERWELSRLIETVIETAIQSTIDKIHRSCCAISILRNTMRTPLDSNIEEITNRLSQSVISKSAVPSWSDLGKASLENRMSSELLGLPLKTRNEVHEEVHGVHCLAREETPALIAASLKKLAEKLRDDNAIPIDEKRAYLESQRYADTYVNKPQFRLRFLRFAFFDATKAAQRMVKSLELLRLLYGEFALRRPIRLSDLSHKEKQYLRNGYFQLLPFRDQSGRRIIFMYLVQTIVSTKSSCNATRASFHGSC